MALGSWMRENGWSHVSIVRVNTNGYPFVTLLTEDGDAENLYLSKNLAASASQGDNPAKFKDCTVKSVTNAAGEERLKLCSAIDLQEYVSVDDL